MSRAVRFRTTGGPEVLELVEVVEPHAGPGEVRVAVRAAGLNPWDTKVRSGLMPTNLPAGQGTEFAGTVDEVGTGTASVSVGDDVLGWASGSAHADFVVVKATSVATKPPGLGWALAGGIGLVANTARRATNAVTPGPGDTVLIGGAAGAVGMLSAQFALRSGAVVIGTARESAHDFLRSLGVVPVAYGDGEAARVRAAAPAGYTAAIDTVGKAFIEQALGLGIAPSRIDTIAYFDGKAEFGVQTVGGGKKTADELAGFARDAAAGTLVLPVRATFPIDQVVAAYTELEHGHGIGKVVLTLP